MNRRRSTLAGLGLAVVLTVAACGDESGDDTTTTGANATPSVEATQEPAASGDAAELFTAMQAAQQEKQTVVATMVTDAAGMSITGGGSLRFAGSVAADMTIEVPLDASGQPEQMRIILLDGAVYMQIPGLSDSVPGKSWIAATGDGTDPFSQAMAPVLDQLSSSLDPSLEMYAHGAELTEAGTEAVEGVETTKYVGSVDLESALAELDGSLAESAQALIDAGSSTLNFTMWVDAESLLRKFESVTEIAGQSATTTVTYSKWGEPVDIAAPPADQVADASALGMS